MVVVVFSVTFELGEVQFDSVLKMMTELLNAMKPIHDVVLLFSYQSDQDNDCISINSNDNNNSYLSWPSE